MNVSAVSSSPAASVELSPKPAPAAAPSAPKADTVTISPAALKASAGKDVDHDGDSH